MRSERKVGGFLKQRTRESGKSVGKEYLALLGLRGMVTPSPLRYERSESEETLEMELFSNAVELDEQCEAWSSQYLVRTIAESLVSLLVIHESGIVHGDISSRNLLWCVGCGHYAVKLIDFEMSSHGGETRRCGTPGFIAPEVLAGKGTSAASDIYSFGIVCLRALGKSALMPAFETEREFYSQLESKDSIERMLRSDCPFAVRSCVLSMLAHEPTQRPSAYTLLTMLLGIDAANLLYRRVVAPICAGNAWSMSSWGRAQTESLSQDILAGVLRKPLLINGRLERARAFFQELLSRILRSNVPLEVSGGGRSHTLTLRDKKLEVRLASRREVRGSLIVEADDPRMWDVRKSLAVLGIESTYRNETESLQHRDSFQCLSLRRMLSIGIQREIVARYSSQWAVVEPARASLHLALIPARCKRYSTVTLGEDRSILIEAGARAAWKALVNETSVLSFDAMIGWEYYERTSRAEQAAVHRKLRESKVVDDYERLFHALKGGSKIDDELGQVLLRLCKSGYVGAVVALLEVNDGNDASGVDAAWCGMVRIAIGRSPRRGVALLESESDDEGSEWLWNHIEAGPTLVSRDAENELLVNGGWTDQELAMWCRSHEKQLVRDVRELWALNCLLRQAVVQEAEAEFEQCKCVLERVLAFADEWGWLPVCSRATILLAKIESALGNHAVARKSLTSIAVARETLGDFVGAGVARSNLAILEVGQSRLTCALELWKDAEVLLRHGNSRQVLLSKLMLSCALNDAGAYGEALLQWGEIRREAELVGAKDLAMTAMLYSAAAHTNAGAVLAAREVIIEVCKEYGCLSKEGWANALTSEIVAIIVEELGLSCFVTHGECGLVQSSLWRRLIGETAAPPFIAEVVHERSRHLFVPAASPSSSSAEDVSAGIRALANRHLDAETVERAAVLMLNAIEHVDRGIRIAREVVDCCLSFGVTCAMPVLEMRALILEGAWLFNAERFREAARPVFKALRLASSNLEAEGCSGPHLWKRRDLRILKEIAFQIMSKFGGNHEQATDYASARQIAEELSTAFIEQSDITGGGDDKWATGMHRILAVTSELNRARKLDLLLQMIIDNVLDLSGGEHGFVALMSDDGIPTVRVARGSGSVTDGVSDNQLSQTIVKRALESQKSVLVKNALDEAGFFNQPSVLNLSLRSAMCSPLICKGKILGVIYVDNRTAVGRFGDDDVRLLELFCSQAAVAIDNSQLFTDLEASYRALAEAHDRIVRSERLKVLGEMAGGVAHDFNNLLTAILVRAQLLQDAVSSAELRSELRLIEKAALDGAAAIKRIQDFTRVRRATNRSRYNVSEALNDAIEFTRGRWGFSAGDAAARWAVDVQCGGLIESVGNISEIREVFTNIILNGIEAMKTGGSLKIWCEVHDASADIHFLDEGPGVDLEIRDRIFDPFFSTKGEGGNGLGLSVAYGIVQRHGGTIRVLDAKQGAHFVVSLPLASD